MRHPGYGLCLVWLMLSPHLAAAVTPSVSPTTIPSATQIVDSQLNVWTVSGGQVYENGQLTPSSGVILLLYAAGIVYQENIHRDWWLWRNGVWVATSVPLVAPSTQAPTQAELNQADVDAANWLTFEQGLPGLSLLVALEPERTERA